MKISYFVKENLEQRSGSFSQSGIKIGVKKCFDSILYFYLYCKCKNSQITEVYLQYKCLFLHKLDIFKDTVNINNFKGTNYHSRSLETHKEEVVVNSSCFYTQYNYESCHISHTFYRISGSQVLLIFQIKLGTKTKPRRQYSIRLRACCAPRKLITCLATRRTFLIF